MRPTKSVHWFRGIGFTLGLLAVYAAAVFVACDESEELSLDQQASTLEASATRPPPPPDDAPMETSSEGAPRLCPSPDPAAAATSTGQTFEIPGGATIPVPKGASTDTYTLPIPAGASTTFYRVSSGPSFVAFDRQGVMSDIGVHPEDCDAFAPTFATLYALMAQIPPPPLVVDGVSIPIPVGGSYSGPPTGGWGPDGPTYGIHRADSFVLFNRTGVVETRISAADETDFQPVLDAIQTLSAQEAP